MIVTKCSTERKGHRSTNLSRCWSDNNAASGAVFCWLSENHYFLKKTDNKPHFYATDTQLWVPADVSSVGRWCEETSQILTSKKEKSILQITIWEQGWGPREESDLVEQNVHYVPCSRADRWRRRLFVATSCSHIRCTSVDALKDVVRRISALKCWVSSDVQTQRTPRVCSRLRSVYLITCCLNSWERVRKVSASKPRTIWPPDIS